MKFSCSKKYDFLPELNIRGFKDQLAVVQETKLLGIILTSATNTEYVCKKAYKKMWTLRRMKKLDVNPSVILDVYMKEIRSLLELAVPAWHSGLTLKQVADIERVQRVALHIILSECNTWKCDISYNMVLVTLTIEPLEERNYATTFP